MVTLVSSAAPLSAAALFTPHSSNNPPPVPLQYKYDRTKSSRFTKAFKMDPRPSAPWSYPQTGQAALLPIYPPYDK